MSPTTAFPAAATEASAGSTPELSSPESAFTRWYRGLLHLWSAAAPYVTTPVAVLFLLPVLMFALIYFSGVVLYFYHKGERVLRRLREAYEDHDIYRASREIIATFWDVQGWIWFGYEVQGLENIPDEGPAMIIYYHGALPVDYYYLVAKVRNEKQIYETCVCVLFLSVFFFFRLFVCFQIR